MKQSNSEVMPQISDSYVQEFFRRRIARINTYSGLNLKEDEVLGLFPFLSNKPILSAEKISVRGNRKDNSFRIKITLKFFHFFLQPDSKFEEKESDDYDSLSHIQKNNNPPELIQALRKIIGLKKGSEHFISQFIVEEETKILTIDTTTQVPVIFRKVLILKDFCP